ELLLIEACQIYGLGIWRDIADHMGTGGPRRRVSVVEAG
ncbi:transcriptional adapter 2-alpha, partial [Puccinia sorghi]